MRNLYEMRLVSKRKNRYVNEILQFKDDYVNFYKLSFQMLISYELLDLHVQCFSTLVRKSQRY